MPKVKESAVAKYLLHKQHLLPPSLAQTVLEVVNDIIALHATSATTPYLSLFARMKQFQRKQLDRELYVNRSLIRLAAMRSTLFILSTTLAPMVFQGTSMGKHKSESILKTWGIPHSEYQRLVDSIYEALKDGPQPLNVIKQSVSPGLIRTIELPAGKQVARMTNVNVVMTILVQQGKVFSEKVSDPILTRHANRYALMRTVYPQLNLEAISSEDAQMQLIKHYINVFGPITEADTAWWTGLGKGRVRTAMSAL
ncbi:MAG: DNA glycosylase AlkZ-like family protein, partial [Promethearchaeota archaeon]